MTNLEYDGQVLANTRREQKLKVDDIATELCLSVQQVEAIENNLGAFFIQMN
jgi:cytoskeletal protein RodZ